ncbi:MAG: hypothetical protein U1F48_19630 [Burkholderiales bacterium]
MHADDLKAAARDVDHSDEWVVICASSADLERSEQLSTAALATGDSHGIVVLPIEGMFVVSPVLGRNAVCAACFHARLRSAPPYPYTAESLRALSRAASNVPTFEYSGVHEGIAAMVAQIAVAHIAQRSPNGVVLNVADLSMITARIDGRHGCPICDTVTSGGAKRFVAFASGLVAQLDNP